ncbi:MAG: alpha/beta fold hydrolase [Myxococcota bacterium]
MNARLGRPPLLLESSDEVTQSTFDGGAVTLRKEKLWLDGLSFVRKYVREDAPKVVLVHGFAQNRYTWHGSRRSISAWLAAEGFDVWNLELRGHGRSRGGDGSVDFSTYVDDVARVAAALGEPAFWVGHSLGGAVIYAGATRSPMRGVVGMGALYRFAQANRALKLLCRLSRQVAGRNLLGALNVRTRLAGKLLGRLYAVSDVAGYAFPISGWAPGSIEEDVLAERLEHGFDWTAANVWLDMARWGSGARFEWADDWQKTDVPLLVMAGDLDHLMLPPDARAAFDESGSRDRTWALFDDYATGLHWGHLDLITGKDAPRHTWRVLRDWLSAR